MSRARSTSFASGSRARATWTDKAASGSVAAAFISFGPTWNGAASASTASSSSISWASAAGRRGAGAAAGRAAPLVAAPIAAASTSVAQPLHLGHEPRQVGAGGLEEPRHGLARLRRRVEMEIAGSRHRAG